MNVVKSELVLIEGYEVDCVWPEARLIVELDSRTHHAVAEAFEADRARDRTLEASGWRVVRLTWRQLHDAPDEVEADLRRVLLSPSHRAWRRSRGGARHAANLSTPQP